MDLTAQAFFSLEQFQHASIFEGTIYVWEALEHLASYLKKQNLGKMESDIPSSVYLKDKDSISIGKGVVIEPGAYIQGPCIIGDNSTIRHGAYIRGHVITGEACVIGHDSEIKHSILLNHASAPHFNYVGDCILGNGVNLGAGVKCANFRLDHQLVPVVIDGKKIVTRLKKFGAIIGDGTQIGCNCVTNPGSLIGKNVLSHPCLSIGGYVPSYGKVKPIHKSIILEK